jgi:hypothetical protein
MHRLKSQPFAPAGVVLFSALMAPKFVETDLSTDYTTGLLKSLEPIIKNVLVIGSFYASFDNLLWAFDCN